MRTSYLAAVLAAVAVSSQAAETELPPVVVTADRVPRTVDDTLAAVSVITHADIERLQPATTAELLRAVPGVSLSNNGGLGKLTTLFLRGTESDHTVVLIDGVKAGSPASGLAALQDLPPEQIERIEVVRGPRSSLYGSEAIGGVIQIFTRKGGGKPRVYASVGAGSHDTYEAQAGVSGGGERGFFNLAVGQIESEGFNACEGKPFPAGGGCFVDEPDDDGYRNTSVSARAGYRFTRGEIDLHGLRAEGSNEFDGSVFVGNENDFVQETYGARLALDPASFWRSSLSGGLSHEDTENFHDGGFVNRIGAMRRTASWQNDISLGEHHLLTLGADYQKESLTGTTAYAGTERDNRAAFGQYQGAFGPVDLQLSFRRDDNEQFGLHNTGAAALGFRFGPALRAYLSHGTAFKAPSFNELYFPFFGNPDLEPETSRSTELGLRGTLQRDTRWSLAVYETRIEQLIGTSPSFTAVNIDEAKIRGLEAEASTRVFGLDLAGSVTLMSPENRSADANDGHMLPRRARRQLRLSADKTLGAVSLGASLFAESRRYSDLANTEELGGYGVLDLRAGVAFARDWRLEGKLGNVLDKEYETSRYFNQPGRTVFVGVRYSPAAR